MQELALVVAGAAIALVSSVTVTWLQGRHTRRAQERAATRDSMRQLTSLFIAERENMVSPASGAREESAGGLAEAEILSAMITERRTRERVREIIRLLRECRLSEMEELSGLKATRAGQMLCDHALDVLGAHFRGERIPPMPDQLRKMRDVEDEALNIYAGTVPASTREPAEMASTPDTSERAEAETVSKGKVRKKPKTGQRSASTTTTAGTAGNGGSTD